MIKIPPNRYNNEANEKLSLSGFTIIPATEKTTDDKNNMAPKSNLFTGIKKSNSAAKNVFIDCAIEANTKLFFSSKINVRSPFLILKTSTIILMPIRKKPANNMVDLKSFSKCMNCSLA